MSLPAASKILQRANQDVAHRRPVPSSSQATEPAVRGQRFPQIVVSASRGPVHTR